MTKQQKEEILAFLNTYRDNGREVTLENAKGAYIGDERAILEQRFSKEQINEIFGEPGHLEKAGAMLEQIRIWHFEGENSFEEELEREKEFLIDIVYQISNACGRLDSSHILWEKYATLYNKIPIDMMQYGTKPLDS